MATLSMETSFLKSNWCVCSAVWTNNCLLFSMGTSEMRRVWFYLLYIQSLLKAAITFPRNLLFSRWNKPSCFSMSSYAMFSSLNHVGNPLLNFAVDQPVHCPLEGFTPSPASVSTAKTKQSMTFLPFSCASLSLCTTLKLRVSISIITVHLSSVSSFLIPLTPGWFETHHVVLGGTHRETAWHRLGGTVNGLRFGLFVSSSFLPKKGLVMVEGCRSCLYAFQSFSHPPGTTFLKSSLSLHRQLGMIHAGELRLVLGWVLSFLEDWLVEQTTPSKWSRGTGHETTKEAWLDERCRVVLREGVATRRLWRQRANPVLKIVSG